MRWPERHRAPERRWPRRYSCLQAEKVAASKLALYKLESRNGRREITFSPKKQPRAIRVELTRLNTDKLYQLEVEESLEPGEYGLSAEGSNTVYCFQVF